MPDALKVVTSVATEAEAEIIRELLLHAGIQSTSQRTIGSAEWGSSGGRAVFVDEADLDRARSVLHAREGEFSDDELARLSEEAGRAANDT